ncbi:MAG: hypothetical protein BWY67_02333 [Bacteroidetes bacterium ADurb.Bin397]|nr:MAG: hypothetical protein BWY67_02333 [Bacteroidetes bacterium ADurb.Bin397]
MIPQIIPCKICRRTISSKENSYMMAICIIATDIICGTNIHPNPGCQILSHVVGRSNGIATHYGAIAAIYCDTA